MPAVYPDGANLIDTNIVVHDNSVMKNVTITLEEDVARWARVRAAEEDTSVSRMVGDLLRRMMEQERSYEIARERFLSVEPTPLKSADSNYPTREELHDRDGLR